jgi:hypothetical protein
MDAEVVFTWAGRAAILGWLVMIVAPRRRAAIDLIAGLLVPALLAAAYTAIVITFWSGADGGFSSLAAVADLFAHRWLLLAGWLHYLAFDLLVGRWELVDAQARGIRHAPVAACLVATFLFGPAGWLAYIALRGLLTRPPEVEASASTGAGALRPADDSRR